VNTVVAIAVRLSLKCYAYLHLATEMGKSRHISLSKQMQCVRFEAAFRFTDTQSDKDNRASIEYSGN
jgi:hypothetical protein